MAKLLMLLLCVMVSCAPTGVAECVGDCVNPDGVRIVTAEELASKNGVEGADIWLAVMGEVFDVTRGRSFYGPGSSYSFFAGKDASPCYASGNFNDEGLKANLDDMSVPQLKAIESWRKFYVDSEKYSFVGLLDDIFYDNNGKPTDALNSVKQRLTTASTPE